MTTLSLTIDSLTLTLPHVQFVDAPTYCVDTWEGFTSSDTVRIDEMWQKDGSGHLFEATITETATGRIISRGRAYSARMALITACLRAEAAAA